MIVDIRGGLGTQLLELMAQYARAIDRGHKITGIRVNCGGESNDGAGNVLRDYVSEIFEQIPVPVIASEGIAKAGVFKSHGTLLSMLVFRERILRALGPLRCHDPAPKLPVLHVRRGNYQWIPMKTYIAYAKAHRVCVIGNIAADTAMVPGKNISSTPVADWFAAFQAPEVIGTASSFLLSMLFINPEKHVAMFSNQKGAVFSEFMLPILQRFAPQFPNLRWLP